MTKLLLVAAILFSSSLALAQDDVMLPSIEAEAPSKVLRFQFNIQECSKTFWRLPGGIQTKKYVPEHKTMDCELVESTGMATCASPIATEKLVFSWVADDATLTVQLSPGPSNISGSMDIRSQKFFFSGMAPNITYSCAGTYSGRGSAAEDVQ